jgi:hypothetical protein
MIFDDEAEKRRRQEQLTGGNTGLNTSGIVGGSTSNQIAQPTAQAPAGSGFANLDRYLSLNQGVGAGLASATNKGLESDVDKYKTDIGSTVTDLQGKIAKSTTDATNTATGIKNSLSQDASANLKPAQDFLASGYKGPAVTDTLTGLNVGKTGLNDRLGKVDDAGQIKSNLTDTYKYNDGFGALDSFLMRGDQSGRDKLAQIKGRSGEVDNAYTTGNTALTGADTAARTAFGGLQQDIKDSAKGLRGNIETAADTRLAGYGAESVGNQGYAAAGRGDVLSEAELADIAALNELGGLDANNYAKTYNAGVKAAPAPVAAPTPPAPDDPNILQAVENKLTPTADSKAETAQYIGAAGAPLQTEKPVSNPLMDLLAPSISTNSPASLISKSTGGLIPKKRLKIKW